MEAFSSQTAPRLRPMNLGDILDGTFRIYRANFLTFIGIVALLQVPMIILQLLLTLSLGQNFTSDLNDLIRVLPRFDPSEDSFNQLPIFSIALFFIVSFGLSIVQGLIVQQLIQGALTNAVAQRYLGQPTSIGRAYNGVVGRLGTLLIAALLLGLIGVVVIGGAAVIIGGLIAAMGAFSAGSDGGFGAALGVLLGVGFLFLLFALIIALALILIRFVFFTQAIVVEDARSVQSLRRSWQLVGGSYWRVLGIILVVSLLTSIVIGIPSGLIGSLIGLVFSDPIEHFVIRQTLSTMVGYLAQIIVLPIQLIAYTLLYFDLRVRKEGYDLELMAQQMHTQSEVTYQQF